MKHILTIALSLLFSMYLSAQDWSLATSLGANYVMDKKTLSDAKTEDLQEAFMQLSYQMYLSEQLHQLEPFFRIQRGDYEGIKIGVKAHLNVLPILNNDTNFKDEKWYIRTLLGAGLVYDSYNDLVDFPIEAKLSIRLNHVFAELGAGANLLEGYYFQYVPELFISIGWVFNTKRNERKR